MTRIHRFANALGQHWVRLVLGFIVGYAVAAAVLIDLLIVIEAQRVQYDFADTYASAALTLLMFLPAAGSLYAYARR